MSNIGMMEGAFFVGRKEIMDWLNSTLDLNLQKVEDTANGAVACQLLDIMYPGAVPMSKVNWSAKQSFEFVANYKILQTCFTKLNIERHIDVDRLITGKYMDNLEFMQWFKRFYEMSVSDKGDYDAYAQRCKGKGSDSPLRLLYSDEMTGLNIPISSIRRRHLQWREGRWRWSCSCQACFCARSRC
jgi:RP/EB family microtubule-associated protein